MRTLRVLVPLALLIGVLGLVTSGSGAADTDNVPTWQHAVKFICGISEADSDSNGPILLGTYSTAINVHNPNSSTIRGSGEGSSTSNSFSSGFRKKALVLYPALVHSENGGEIPQGPLPWFRAPDLPRDWGFEIDCADIRNVLLEGDDRQGRELIKGFVVIEARGKLPLDVVAVYTQQNPSSTSPVPTSESVETVQPKKIQSG